MYDTIDSTLAVLTAYTIGFLAFVFCGGAAIVGFAGCILAAALYAGGCLSCPQHDNHDIPMDEIQADFETAGNDSDLAEAI